MRRHFFVGIDSQTKEINESIRKWIEEQEAFWWHWIDGVWLIVFEKEINAQSIREQIKGLAPGSTLLVSEVVIKDWAGFGPSKDDRSMFNWLQENWIPPDA